MIGALLRTLSWKVVDVRRRWVEEPATRLKYELGRRERLFANACEHPIRWSGVVFCLGLLTSVGTSYLRPPYQGLIAWGPQGLPNEGWDVVAPFLGLWAVQAALVAVVYPIVVAFVTVLLQRQNASRASLHAYFANSAAKLTGMSSLALVLLMACQFIVLTDLPAPVSFAWLIADAAWACANVALVAFFLHVTFDFASPEGRAQARLKYFLTRGWLHEWEYHVKRLISRVPIEHGLMSAEVASRDLDGTGPAFSNPQDGLAKGEPIHFSFRGERFVAEVRYAWVQVAYAIWRLRNRRHVALAGRRLGWRRSGPVFQMSVVYGDRISALDPIAVAPGGGVMGVILKFVLHMAVVLSRRNVAPRVQVRDAVEEMKTDAGFSIHEDSESEFDRHINHLIELIDSVVEASAYRQNGELDNWVLLVDSDHVMGLELIWTWLRPVRDLHGLALKAMEVRDVYASRTVRVPSRMVIRQADSLNDRLRRIYVQHQYLLVYDLLGRGAEACASSSFVDGDPGALPDEPFRRRYERVLRDAVGAWESMKSYRLYPSKTSEVMNWSESASAAETLAVHLRFGAQLVAHALRANDRLAFEYFTDTLLKWADFGGTYEANRGVEYTERYLVTLADLNMAFSEFRDRFPLPPHETEGPEIIAAIKNLALRNMWRDVNLTLLASTLSQVNSGAISRGLAGRLVEHVMDGLPLLPGGDVGSDTRPFVNADRVLGALVRQLVAGVSQRERYRDQIDKVAESLGVSEVEKGISERVYSRVGSEIDYIRDAQLLLLARTVPKVWNPTTQIDRTMRGWAADDELRRQMIDQLKGWIGRLGEAGGVAARFGWLWDVAAPEGGRPIDEHLQSTKSGLEQLLARLDNLRTKQIKDAPVSQEAVYRIEASASRAVKKPYRFPLSLLSEDIEVHVGPKGSPTGLARISGFDKGALTQPLMAQLAANEDEWLEEIVKRALAAKVLSEIVYRKGFQQQQISDRTEWLKVLSEWEQRCIYLGLTPIAIIPSRADPPWLRELARERSGETDEASTIRRRAEFKNVSGYVGHFGEVGIFVGALSAGLTVLATREEFAGMRLQSDDSKPFVVDVTVEDTQLSCTLEISWRHQLIGVEGPVAHVSHTAAEKGVPVN